tara:strand:- start:93 stop:704 length:612 start_codon:yes stop_codon:yes gene_type:complete
MFGAILLMGFPLFSQLDKGTFLLDGSSSLNFLNDRIMDGDPSGLDSDITQTQRQINANVTGGYFIIKGLLVGVQLQFTNVTQISESETMNYESLLSLSSFSVAPTIRYYIGDIGLWGQVSYGLGQQIQKFEDSDFDIEDSFSTKIGDLGIKLGYAIFLGEKVSLNPSLGYSMKSFRQEDTDLLSSDTQNTSGINFNFGIALHL